MKTIVHTDEITLSRVLGTGSFGQVRKVYIRGQHYAMKVPKSDDDDDSILTEGRLLAKLPSHENIITLHAVSVDFETSKERFLVLQLLNRTLDHQLLRWRYHQSVPNRRNILLQGSMIRQQQITRVLEVGLPVARALAHLHANRILYRDLKPENVGYHDETIKLFDFGLARSMDEPRQLSMAGTLRYMAPEALTDQYDERVDVYSFGMLLFEVCTLQKPHRRIRCSKELMKQISRRPSLHLVASRSLRNLIASCWHKEPSMRPTMTTVIQELQLLTRN